MSEEEIEVDVVIENEEGAVDATSDVLKGDKGEKGDPTATIKINEVITGEEGTEAKIENVGTDINLKLNITIPRGNKGKQGDRGEQGYTPKKGTDYFTEEEIQEIKSNILDQVNQFSVLVVEKLPTENIDAHTIYFVPKTKTEQDDVYDEYIYINNGWEHIGTTEVDLSSYYKKEEIDTKLSEVEGNEVFVGNPAEAPSSAKIIVEEDDFEESSTLGKSEVYVGTEEPTAGEKVWFKNDNNSIYVRNNGVYEKFENNSFTIITENDWIIKKYNNGYFEAWLPQSATRTTSINTAWGGLYTTPSITLESPSITKTLMFANVNASPTNAYGFALSFIENKNIIFRILSNSSQASITYRLASYVAGTWE